MKQDNFYELVEQYLDPEAIKEKYELDDTFEEKDVVSSKSPFSISDAITINDYVNNFLNIKVDASNLYHCGLKQINCPYVIAVSNNFSNKNPEYVKLGFLLIVIDANNNRGTYLNPFYINQLLYKNSLKEKITECEFMELKSKLNTDEQFYSIMKSQKKLKKIKQLKKYEGMGNIL